MAGAGPVQNHEPGTSSVSRTGVQEPKDFHHLLLFFQANIVESEIEQPDSNQCPEGMLALQVVNWLAAPWHYPPKLLF